MLKVAPSNAIILNDLAKIKIQETLTMEGAWRLRT